MFKVGIVGLEQVGKSLLFRIVTHAHSGALAPGKPEAHMAVVHVPDRRLDRLAEMVRPRKTVHGSMEFVDTPGSVIALARTGTQISSLGEMDALAHVVRAFEGEATSLEGGVMKLRRDIENVELELILSDLAVAERRLERLEKEMKKQKNPALEREHQVFEVLKQALEKQMPLREIALNPDEERVIQGFTFLSRKPTLYVVNFAERDAARTDTAEEFFATTGLKRRPQTAVTGICGKVESELTELSDAEAAEFLGSYGLRDSAAARVIRTSYQLLGLISFFTFAGDECRAWTIRAGTTALEAAGEVHSDFQKGFIRAEVVKFDDLAAAGGLAGARKAGLLRLEGKDYVLSDGEVVYFRHSG